MKSIIKVYKNLIPEEDRQKSLQLMKSFPDSLMTQSVCTDEEVYQLKEYLPLPIAKQLANLHYNSMPNIRQDFGLAEDGIKLIPPSYFDRVGNDFITVDKRIPGMYLSLHRDVPTGTYAGHFGVENGMTAITMSAIYYWNDDYEGGELVFDDETLLSEKDLSDEDKNDPSILKAPYKYKPVAGDYVVFPSHLYHEILEIKSGERYSSQYFFNRRTPYNIDILPKPNRRTIKS